SHVADPLALVRLGGPDLAGLGRRLSHHLLVDALDESLGRGLPPRGVAPAPAAVRARPPERHPLPRPDGHGMGEADRELEVGSLELGAIADSVDLELLLEALRHAVHHVRDQGPRETVLRAVLAALGAPR